MAVRAAYLRQSLQLVNELVVASGIRHPVNALEEPPAPPRDMQRRLAKAIRECCASIRQNRPNTERKLRRLSRSDVLAIEKLLARGVSVRRIGQLLGRHTSTIRAIRDGKHCPTLPVPHPVLLRCPDCGGLAMNPELPCRLCESRRVPNSQSVE